jgi:hypothetical protein
MLKFRLSNLLTRPVPTKVSQIGLRTECVYGSECYISVKTLGHHILPENYNWTSDKLQDMTGETAKKYPEEIPTHANSISLNPITWNLSMSEHS